MASVEVTVPERFPWQGKLDAAVKGIDFETGLAMKKRPKRILCVMGRRAGKTMACSLTAGETALRLRGSKIFWGAHTYDGCRIGHEIFHGPVWVDMGGGRQSYTMFDPVVEKALQDPLESRLIGDSRLYWRSMEGKGTAIGRGWDLAIIDEFDRIDPQVIKQDVIPATADTGGPVIAITTPQPKGLGFEWFNKAKDGNPLYHVIHGSTLENPSPHVKEWVKEFVEDVGEDDPLYRQEILALYLEGQGSVFRNVKANATLEGWHDEPVEGGLYVIGADIGEHRDFFCVTVLEAMTGELHAHFRVRHMPWAEQAVLLKQIWDKWGQGPLWIDATGVGDPVYQNCIALGINAIPVKFHSENKTNMVNALRIAMSKGDVRYPPEPTLLHELEVFGYDTLPSGRIRYRAPGSQHDDWVTALGLAWWGRQQGIGWGAGADMANMGWVA